MVPADAAKCSGCGEWREDIKKERNLYYLWSVIEILTIIAFIYGKSHRWWPPVVPKSSGRQTLLDIVGTFSATLRGFDWGTFFSSPSGLAVAAGVVIALGITIKYYVSVSKKMGNWIWL